MKKSLTEQVDDILKDYVNDVTMASNEAVKVCAKESVKQLKAYRGYEDHDKKNGFRRSWKTEIEKNRLGDKAIVYNTNAGQTTWLEFGHVKRNGGRTEAFPHIADVQTAVGEIFVNQFERGI